MNQYNPKGRFAEGSRREAELRAKGKVDQNGRWVGKSKRAGKPNGSGGGNAHQIPAEPGTGARWSDDAQANRRGDALPNLRNALLALRSDPRWQGRLAYDEMRRLATLDGKPIETNELADAQEWLQNNGLYMIGPETTRTALERAAADHPHHPLREWMRALVWDQTDRLVGWLPRYLGTPDDNYHRSIGFWFFLSMVARVMRPGCKADYMLVLEGPQGALKSSAIAAIGGEYFSDSLPDIGDDPVRLSMHLRGKLIIEIPELSAFSRADQSRLKAFVTRATEEYVPKFGRTEVAEPRQCVLIGTTNKQTYLLDDTGARRFWPVACGPIDLDALKRDREQLFAEAVHWFDAGKQWWPDPRFAETTIKPVQDARYDADAWDQPVLAYVSALSRTTLLDVAENALGFQKHQFGRTQQLRVAGILRQAGWKSRRSTGGVVLFERLSQPVAEPQS